MSDLESAVWEELEGWGLAGSALGAAALDLAQRIDNPGLRPAAAAMLHAQLGARLSDLRKLAPQAEVADDVDSLKAELRLLPPARESG